MKRNLPAFILLLGWLAVALSGCKPPAPVVSDDDDPFAYVRVRDFCQEYGYETGLILAKSPAEAQLLLCHEQLASTDDLAAVLLALSDQGAVRRQEVRLPEALLGYRLAFKFGDASEKRHLLGHRSRIDTAQKRLYSDLFVMDKADLEHITFLQTYQSDYDAAIGLVPQSVIPVIIDFSVDVIGDHLIYQDIDGFWKVQDVRSGEVYTSQVSAAADADAQPAYATAGEYIHLLRFVEDGRLLAFNVNSKSFALLQEQ